MHESDPDHVPITGGRPQISRRDNAVRRPAGPWTPHTQRLLRHLRAAGFHGAPEALGWDDAFEYVSYIPGAVSNYPLSPAAASQAALLSAARLLRAYHDASVGFLAGLRGDEPWYLPARTPAEVLCHGDFAPYNVVLDGQQAVAIIDFDTAHPGPRAWDIAYALYRWAPLVRPGSPEGLGVEADRPARARLFCDAYGLAPAVRADLIATMITRLEALVAFMRARAAAGDATFQEHIAAGHAQTYLADIDYLAAHEGWLARQLTT